MPAIQIATFAVSGDFSSPELFKAPLEAIKTADGHISSFYGVQVEDVKKGYFISVWESYEHHQKLTQQASYKNIIEVLKPAAAGGFERDHINVAVDPNTALTSPAVEVVAFTLKEGSAAEQLTPLFEELGKGLDAAVGSHAPCVWGQSIEDKSKFLLVVGWDTVEAHWEAVKEGTSLHKTIQQIAALADLSIGHTHAKQHQG
ncbi:hypothetical protein C8F04DRAFT_503802 [Mycena alexandri]|uniref:ABM domain-containing protein n=1 Tax=Mycena alexandri TaxID=1745969 RepID=A0AAD6WPZ3_9AGAR|nr:hypothetical protein C8F04DRAFT_503802 [Mycena alexandri]